MSNDPYEFADHLGDGVYVKYNGFAYEFQVNNHENPTVLFMEPGIIDALNRFRARMEAKKT